MTKGKSYSKSEAPLNWPLRRDSSPDIASDFRSKIRWLLVARFGMFLLIAGAVVLLFSTEALLFRFLFAYGLITLGYFLSLLWWNQTRREISFKFLCAVQLLFEIIIEVAIIHYSGGIASPFIVLLGLSIITSAFIFELTGTLITATVGVLLLGATVYLEFTGVFEFTSEYPGVSTIYSDSELLFFTFYVYTCFLYLIAFLIGYLSGKLRHRLGQLVEANRELRRARMDTDDILMYMRSGLITLDPDGHVVYFNRAAGDLLGIAPERARNEFLTEILPLRARPFGLKLTELLSPGGERVRTGEFSIESNSGEIITMLLACSFLTSPDGSMRGIIALFEDVTEQKRREEYLKEVEKMATIGELSASLAHEIRNPLAAIRASVETLANDDELELPKDNRLMKLIIKETDRLTSVLDEFLIFARLKELPLEQVTYNKLDLSAMINEVIVMLRNSPEFPPEIEIENNLTEPLWIMGREDQLKNVFYNIIINAREAIGDQKGTITIDKARERAGFYAEKRLIGVSITDNGKGIPAEEMGKIFTPFYSTKPRGTGLGLAIAQGIVNRHSGIIEGENLPQGGTRFTVYLLKSLSD
ncbi:MAG: two-component system sensor histidine kinase NtrB [bacterium]